MSSIVIGIDESEFDAILDSVLADTEKAMQMVEQVEEKKDEVEEETRQFLVDANASLRRVISFSRRTASSVRAVLAASGSASTQTFATIMEAALLTAEIILDIAAAEGSTLVGAARAAPKIYLAISLAQKARALALQQEEAAAEIDRQIAIISPWTY